MENNQNLVAPVVSEHEITESDYKKMAFNFWENDPVQLFSMDIDALKIILGGVTTELYLQFTFSNRKVVDDFNFITVINHVFDSFNSCYPIVLLENIIDDPSFKNLAITKGITTLDTPKYKGDYYIALLVFTEATGSKKYYDIIHDPTLN